MTNTLVAILIVGLAAAVWNFSQGQADQAQFFASSLNLDDGKSLPDKPTNPPTFTYDFAPNIGFSYAVSSAIYVPRTNR